MTHNHPALSHEAFSFQYIGEVAGLVRVDEDEVPFGLRGDLLEGLGGGPHDDLDFGREAGVIDVLLRNLSAV